jgi:hypothetical protein
MFENLVVTHHKHRHLFFPPSDDRDVLYDDWLADNTTIIAWLLSNMESSVAHEMTILYPMK